MPEEIVMRHRIPQFGHIFQAMDMLQVLQYLWADVMHGCGLLPKETDHMTKKSRRGFTKRFSVEYYRSRRCLQKFGDVTPRVMLS
jgi:hypothetical protein